MLNVNVKKNAELIDHVSIMLAMLSAHVVDLHCYDGDDRGTSLQMSSMPLCREVRRDY